MTVSPGRKGKTRPSGERHLKTRANTEGDKRKVSLVYLANKSRTDSYDFDGSI